MGKTLKDLKSHKKGFGRYGFNKPKRKLTPMKRVADKITGKNSGQLVFIDHHDISQDNFMYDEKNPRKHNTHHWHNAKSVRAIRKQERVERKQETSSARQRLKSQLKKEIKYSESAKNDVTKTQDNETRR